MSIIKQILHTAMLVIKAYYYPRNGNIPLSLRPDVQHSSVQYLLNIILDWNEPKQPPRWHGP